MNTCRSSAKESPVTGVAGCVTIARSPGPAVCAVTTSAAAASPKIASAPTTSTCRRREIMAIPLEGKGGLNEHAVEIRLSGPPSLTKLHFECREIGQLVADAYGRFGITQIAKDRLDG